MKRIKTALCTLLIVCFTFTLSACTEWQPQGAMSLSNGQATAIGLGHQNCVIEVTAVVDGFGNATKVRFDEIFPVNNVVSNVNLTTEADKVEIGGKSYFQYLRIGDKYFQAGTEANKYAQIGVENGIADLIAYCKTEEGLAWYYDAIVNKQAQVQKIDASGVQVGSVQLKDAKAFNTANGSMRKRYSTYWSTGGGGALSTGVLGFNGNMDMLENYLITYGFDKIDDVVLASKDNPFNIIGGITTGATLSGDTKLYLKVAKAAYDKALTKRTERK